MLITNTNLDGFEVLSFTGVLNTDTIYLFRQEIDRINKNENIDYVILDFEKLEQIDSSGIGIIISLLKSMRLRNGDVRIIKLRGAVKQLFELLRIDRGINIYNSLEEAME